MGHGQDRRGQGADRLYFGHGNGWPSPYTYDPNYTTKDGLGLNATAGTATATSSTTASRMSPSLDLAPNAVVLLNHLCYASGNSEPGSRADQSIAMQRVDNYGAGFIRAGVKAVIAEGHGRSSIPPGPLHDPPARRSTCGGARRTPRQRVLVRVGPDPG